MKKLTLLLLGCLAIPSFAQKKWSLKECVDFAVENNLQVIQNKYNKSLAESNVSIAERDKLPSVNASWNHNVNFGAVRFGTIVQRNDAYSNNANVNANILLYNHERLSKNLRRVQYDLEASQYDLEAIKNDISIQIAQQYLTILLNKEVRKIAQSAVDNAQKIYDRAKITTEVGTTAQTVLAEAEASLAREKQNWTTADINLKRSLFDMSQLLQLESFKGFEVMDVEFNDELERSMVSADNVMDIALREQPQIKSAESSYEAAKAQTEVTKTAFWPTISGSAGLGTNYFDSLNSPDESIGTQYKDNFSQQVAISASFPIFNKGITRLQVQQSKINEDRAKTAIDQQKQIIRQSVQRAEFDAQANYERYVAALETEKSTALSLDFTEKSYAAGRSTIYDVNIARNNYVNAQGSTAQAKYNYLFSLKLINFYAGVPITL